MTIGVLLLLAVALTGSGESETLARERFEKSVRPLLAEHCWRCHGPEKQRAGLRLDSAEAVRAGSDSGPVVVPGRPDASPLVAAVRYGGELRMPPKGKLADTEIAALVEWVRSGADWPGEPPARTASPDSTTPPGETPRSTAEETAFWAFQPLADPSPPAVRDESWSRSPIDRFIAASLEARGLAPAPQADKRTLIRRATYDLIGLPPTPEQIAAFLADPAPDAFDRVVERLLASPRYGERWARHWLDLARYADSNGMDENVAYANAWRYRDYVVAAFNKDKPYDQFLREQLAGDLLPAADEPARHEQLTATGFLVLGPKMLAEDDPVKMEMDIIDEQVDTIGKVFLGLTLGCARCHDHKFDPIPTTDYYGLAGIFKSTRTMANHKVVAMWHERPLATAEQTAELERIQQAVAELEALVKKTAAQARKALEREARSRVADYLLAASQARRAAAFLRPVMAAGPLPRGVVTREAEAFQRGNLKIDHDQYGRGIGVVLNAGPMPNHAEYDIELAEPALYQVELRYAAAEPRPVRVFLNGEPLGDRVAAAATGSWGPDGQTWTVAGARTLGTGTARLRIERGDGPIPHFDKFAFVPRDPPENLDPAALVSPEALARQRGLNPRWIGRWTAAIAQAETNPDSVFRPWLAGGSAELAATFAQSFEQAADADPDDLANNPMLAAFRRVLDDPNGPLSVPKMPDEDFPPETAAELDRLNQAIQRHHAAAPPVPAVMSVEDQQAQDLRVHIRGSHLVLGDLVPRRFPRILAGAAQETIGRDRSGRLELADWLTRPNHPLTARVLVNRLWLWHFGQGLVRSPDNFGRLGERPTHPELLDWLARRFIASGWSIKAMHRLILGSAVYQMSSRHNAAALLADPENRLRWRFDRRRLEAEALRDALLALGGLLDDRMGGTRLPVKNHAYVSSTVTAQKVSIYDANVRSLYLPVIRSGLYPVFQVFDFADPSTSNGQRATTTVAPQALFLLNDGLVRRAAAGWASRLLGRGGLDDAGRIRLAYEFAYGRPASDAECRRALDYLQRFEALLAAAEPRADGHPEQAWQMLCQALMAASEFMTIE